MTNYDWAAIGVLATGIAILLTDKYLGDRIRHAITVRRFRRDIDTHEQRQAAIARLKDEIAETERRLRDHYRDGGDA